MTYIKPIIRYTLPCLLVCNSYANFEEVTVTAQKRQQQIKDVPFSVSALSQQQLEYANITDLNSLSSVIPGLNISAAGPNQIAYTIRGINTGQPSAQEAPRIAVYLNDVDISRNRSSMTELYDLERIEVVKGPQTTLFGTTASAGAIAIYTQAPKQERETKATLGLGSDNLYTFELSSTGGNEQLQARIALMSKSRDGYIKNTLNPDEDLGSLDRFSIRPSLRLTPGDNTQIDLVITHETAQDTVIANKSGIIAPAGGDTSPFTAAAMSGNLIASPLFSKTGLNLDRTTNDYNLKVSHDIGNRTFTSITGFREFDSITPFDADGSQAYAFELLEEASGEQISQEFRFNQTGEDYNLHAGLSYLKEQNQRTNSFAADEGSYMLCIPAARTSFSRVINNEVQNDPSNTTLVIFSQLLNPVTGLPCVNNDGSVNSLSPLLSSFPLIPYYSQLTDYGDNTSYSAYIDGSYQLNEQLELSLGVRYIEEDRDSGFKATVPNANLLQGQLPLLKLGDTAGNAINAGNKKDDVLWRANLRYDINDETNAYLAYSEGRRSAVTRVTTDLDSNFQAFIDIDQAPTEILKNYELGIKGTKQQIAYAGAVFYQDYSDYQVNFLNANNQFTVSNAGNTSMLGAEFEASWQLNKQFLLFANASYIENTFEENIENGLFAGNMLVFSPQKTAAIGSFYQNTLSNGYELFAHVNASYQSKVAFDNLRQPNEPTSGLPLTQGGYTLVNASLGFTMPNKHVVRLWVNNLTDKDYLLNASGIGSNVGAPTYSAATPRMWGLSFTINYN